MIVHSECLKQIEMSRDQQKANKAGGANIIAADINAQLIEGSLLGKRSQATVADDDGIDSAVTNGISASIADNQ